MARQPRHDLPGIPQHIVQRGNNRLPCFLDEVDRRTYLHLLAEALHCTGCRLHGWVLMDNHVHLLLTPPHAGAAGALMQRLGRNYVPLFNTRHGRTGTLWEGRYKASLVASDHYLLQCLRYIELNPVRAAITDDPARYRWSSCQPHLGLRTGKHLTHHPLWLASGNTPSERAQWWRIFLREAVSDNKLTAMLTILLQQRALDTTTFQAMVQAKTHRFTGTGPAHRPPKQKDQATST